MITHCEHMLVVYDLDELVTVLTFLKDPLTFGLDLNVGSVCVYMLW